MYIREYPNQFKVLPAMEHGKTDLVPQRPRVSVLSCKENFKAVCVLVYQKNVLSVLSWLSNVAF